ncbi:endonuclease/exonuclease/phosphatase family protein [Xanthomonas prunicola]|uniref:Endonuclease/exonuclease/phosphatase family protein n=1 Tax=Xanthomonas prunicola TaxID=2053930 RepID=A0A9Q9MX70_9XANT|nr:endonuclease/exonuclease/phosphatase family protein [Xanthomonas prunicola]USJ02932.1 endonuclease/exonuclease/phosphatase family protein [Xanthomonas prunicola]UXA51260.1 endonuclease/exonuclease/phosphatase family protein [Xanthomonas prunicola]UXA53460.1 endonuclease/exonuclease/phosphatase family protein [Xanthomonas prunicola]UXA59498.1 endonuclease/exonuclease/phosphatase family protein [Xanthomonas prunicola]UXA63444.1 endonuclease/exonuclease/phosphatase family protein [Xanthomonas 
MLALLLCSTGLQAGQATQGMHSSQILQRGNIDPAMRAAESPSAASREMTLVTLNLHHDREDWPGRRAYIAKELKQLAPDVIALQEVIERRGSVENQAAWLARKLGYDYTFASVDPVGAAKRYGNALLSRRKVLATHQRLLQPLDDYRVAAHLQVDVNGQPVNIYVTHLNERTDARGTVTRTRQVADLLDFIASNSKQAPVVIAGDFNTAADTLDLEALRKGYGDSYGSVHRNSDATVSTLNMHVFDKPARIDHVFFQQNRLLAREARILFDRPYADGRWASDHYGVWVRLQLAPDQLAAP